MKKCITPKLHGIIDYGLTTAMATIPQAIGVNKKAIIMYRVLAANLTTYNALTDNGVAVKPVIPLRPI